MPLLAGALADPTDVVPPWQTWTPTLTNLTLGNGSVLAVYQQIGKSVFYRFRFTRGSSGSAVGTLPTISLPVMPSADYVADEPIGTVCLIDAGANQYDGQMIYSGSGNARFKVSNSASTYASLVDVTATVPFTWGSGDKLIVDGFYVAA